MNKQYKITTNKINVHVWKTSKGKPCRYRFPTEGGSLTWVEKVDARCKRLLNPLEEPVSLHIRFSLSRLPSKTVSKISPRRKTFKRDGIKRTFNIYYLISNQIKDTKFHNY